MNSLLGCYFLYICTVYKSLCINSYVGVENKSNVG